jgi:hypothetical protein
MATSCVYADTALSIHADGRTSQRTMPLDAYRCARYAISHDLGTNADQ